MIEIKGCPFCGTLPEVYSFRGLVVPRCGCIKEWEDIEVPISTWQERPREEDLSEDWNGIYEEVNEELDNLRYDYDKLYDKSLELEEKVEQLTQELIDRE